MLTSFRNFSKSMVGTVVLALFVVTIFASFALADITGLAAARSAARAAGRWSRPATSR